MAQKQKLDSFFNSRRREATLRKWEHLKTVGNEDRIKMNLIMPLLNTSLKDAPAALQTAYTAMEKDNCGISRTKLDIYCAGMTVDIFSLPRTEGKLIEAEGNPYISVMGVTLDKFQVVSNGEAGDKRKVELEFVAYVPANEKFRDWCWFHNHQTFFMEAVYSQSEIDFGEAVTNGDDAEVTNEETVAESVSTVGTTEGVKEEEVTANW